MQSPRSLFNIYRTHIITHQIILAFQTTFATFGGLDKDGKRTNKVTLVNMETKKSCTHYKNLPVAMKETFVFDYKDTLLVCSANTEDDEENLQCFKWEGEDWISLTPNNDENNGVYSWISAVRVPGWGIWFITVQVKQFQFGIPYPHHY